MTTQTQSKQPTQKHRSWSARLDDGPVLTRLTQVDFQAGR